MYKRQVLQYVVADAGRPLQAGIGQIQAQRAQDNQAPLASSLDVFHTKHEAGKALTSDWNPVERDCKAFDQAEAQLRKDQRQGINAVPAAMRARRAWNKLVQSFNRYETIEAAWMSVTVREGATFSARCVPDRNRWGSAKWHPLGWLGSRMDRL